jgi:hypothetical protein
MNPNIIKKNQAVSHTKSFKKVDLTTNSLLEDIGQFHSKNIFSQLLKSNKINEEKFKKSKLDEQNKHAKSENGVAKA